MSEQLGTCGNTGDYPAHDGCGQPHLWSGRCWNWKPLPEAGSQEDQPKTISNEKLSSMLGDFTRVMHPLSGPYKFPDDECGSQEDAGQSANYMQQLPGGLCFAHGKYPGMQCPEFPKCATDPQKPEYLAMAGNWSAPSPVGTQSAIQIALETLNREKGELRTQLEEANRRGRKAELLFADQCANVAALVKPLEDQIAELQAELSQRDEDDKLVQNHYNEGIEAYEKDLATLRAELSQVRAENQKLKERE